jgi:thioredoxin
MRPLLDVPIRTSAAHLERILAANQPTLVVFETPECEPCRTLHSPLDDLAREFAGRAVIVRVEDADQGWLAARHHLFFVPTLVFWRHGDEQARIDGNPGPAVIRAHLEYLLTEGPRPDVASGPRHTLYAFYGGSRPRAAGGEACRLLERP